MSSSSRSREVRLTILLGVVVLLLWLLWEGASRNIGGIYESGTSVRVRQDLSMFQSALNLFEMSTGRYPSNEEGLEALVEPPIESDLDNWEQALRQERLDPWLNPCGYEFSSKRGMSMPDIFSAGPDTIFGTENDIGNCEG